MKAGFLSRVLVLPARALPPASICCVALVLASVPAAAQVVIGGSGLPPVEVNMEALDALPQSTGAAPLQLPGASPSDPVQLRAPGTARAALAAPAFVPAPEPMPAPAPVASAPLPAAAAPVPAAPQPPALVLAPPAEPEPPSAAGTEMPETPAAAEVPPLAGTVRPAPAAAPAPAPAEPRVADLGPTALPDGALSVVRFSGAETELSPSARDQLQQVAVQLASTENRVQLNAFAGGSAETASAARRLSLSRALTVRAYLIELGVRSTRIDVRALGIAGGDGPAERVDILLLAQ